MQAPWTEIGRLESDVRDIRSQLSQMAKSYELHQVIGSVDSLAHTLRSLSGTFDGFRIEFETLQEDVRILIERVGGET